MIMLKTGIGTETKRLPTQNFRQGHDCVRWKYTYWCLAKKEHAMKINSVAAIMLALLGLFMSSCGRKADREAEPKGPLATAFRPEEIGKALDREAWSAPDRSLVESLERGDLEQARLALTKGANANLDCGHGLTVLMLAAATGSKPLTTLFLEKGAVVTAEAAPFLEIPDFRERAQSPQFQQSLGEIRQILGVAAATNGHLGAYVARVEAARAKDFLDKHHAALLAKGCYAFLADQHFGIGGDLDAIMFLPTTNKYAVMAFTGVNGCNYDLNTCLLIKWMQRLEREQPYWLTGCGMDFMSGRFKAKLKNPEAMAKAMYAFCPDIVDQGTGSEEALRQELEKTNEFYFWWD
jgi:hypothetical protein